MAPTLTGSASLLAMDELFLDSVSLPILVIKAFTDPVFAVVYVATAVSLELVT